MVLSDNLKAWLLKKEPVSIIPVFDRLVAVLVRIVYIACYVILRIFLRIVLGKKRRNKFLARKRIRFNYEIDIIPAFFLCKIIYLIMRLFGFKNYNVRVSVPKFNFKAYCPANKNELINIAIREDEIIEHFCVREGDIVIDIGAHIGHYTLIASKRAGHTGKVVAIEAHPYNFEILKRNIKLNKLTNVTALNVAAYSSEGWVKLYMKNVTPGYTIYHTLVSKRFDQIDFLEIYASTLDRIVTRNQISPSEINWIKIDVEGAELEVLRGAKNVLSKSKNITLLIEIHRLGLINLYQPVVDFLLPYGFKIQYEMMHEGGEAHIIARKLIDELK